MEEPEPIKMDVGFDLNDLLNKIPFMYPGKEPCTWRSESTDFPLVQKDNDSDAGSGSIWFMNSWTP